MKIAIFALTVLFAASAVPGVAAAQKAKNTCPGGLQGCLDRCYKAGGQTRLCPTYCRKQKGC